MTQQENHFNHESGSNAKCMVVTISIAICLMENKLKFLFFIHIVSSPIQREKTFFIHADKSSNSLPYQFPSHDILKVNNRRK